MSALLPAYRRGIGVSQSGSTGAAPPEERFWDICREQVSDR